MRAISIPFSPQTLNIILPVGISFYTFQTLSYTIDVYRGKVVPEKHFGIFALYVSFFPQLVAGPIERPQNLLPQLKDEQFFDYNKSTYGLKLMAWGFFKKLCIADVVSVYVNKVYNNIPSNTGLVLVVATVFFALQIYCDFSGYSDIAIGAAKLLGIDLMKNFDSPYFSKNIKEFWARWHISLSTWFRDYVYIPLGGSRVSPPRHYFNLFITFLVSGLWHGANFTFVLWGALHGIALVLYEIFKKYIMPSKQRTGKFMRLTDAVSIAATFVFVCLTWVFFRANSVSDAVFVLRNMLVGISGPIEYIKIGFGSLLAIGINKTTLLFIATPIFGLCLYDMLSLKRDILLKITAMPKAVKYLVYCGFVVFIVLFAQKNAPAEFIYFQF